MKDETASGMWGASKWVLAVAATAGLGVGVGASVAAGRSGSGDVKGVSAAPVAPVASEPVGERVAPAATKPEAIKPAVVAPEPVAEVAVVAVPEAVEAPEVPEAVVAPSGPLDMTAVDAALDETFKKQKANRAFAKDFYATHGAGRFASDGGPTALGAAVVARAQSVAEHGIDASGYADVATTGTGAELDARLFETYLDLVLDFRFLHKAGPFRVWDRGDIYDKEKKELKAFIAQMMAAPDADAAVAMLDSPHPQYQQMKAALGEYRKAVEANACPKLSPGWRFRSGSHGAEVKKLQERLACEGYYAGELDGKFEGPTVEAVKAYQEHHDLPAEGNVLDDTMKSLNVPLERRVKQIELALQRMREAQVASMGDFFIRVNIPSFRLKVFEKGQVIKEHRVIVGTNRLDDDKVQLVQGHINRTKLFGTRLYEVIVNPTWILPKRVEEGELKSSVEKDADYLAKSNIKKVTLGSGTEVLVQGAGKGNVLGKVKFLLQDTNAIYLHDTDKRQLFKKQRRDFSHGCMRVDEAIDFGKWLLARDGFPSDEVDRAFAASSLQRGFDLKSPVNLVTEYITVDLATDGKPVFYDDIYGYDDDYFDGKLPPNEKTRWGNSILRPRWVPVMDSETVDGWRKAGKAAPRNLGPDGKPKPPSKKPDVDVDEGP